MQFCKYNHILPNTKIKEKASISTRLLIQETRSGATLFDPLPLVAYSLLDLLEYTSLLLFSQPYPHLISLYYILSNSFNSSKHIYYRSNIILKYLGRSIELENLYFGCIVVIKMVFLINVQTLMVKMVKLELFNTNLQTTP